MITFYTYSVYIHVLALKMALINLVGKTFTVCRKFAKTVNPIKILSFKIFLFLSIHTPC